VLRDYQTKGVDFLLSGSARFLADDPGLGKSLQAIEAAIKAGHERILVVAPAIGRVSWSQQVETWGQSRYALVIADKNTPVFPKGPSVVVLSYNALQDKGLLAESTTHVWDVLILDEAHYLKSPLAARTRAVYGPALDGKGGLVSAAKNVWPMSGSPCPNHLGELWTHVHALAPEIMHAVSGRRLSHSEWIELFCTVRHDPRYGPKVTGSKNQDVLRPHLREFMLRRRKGEVLTELPPLQYVEERIDPSVLPSCARMMLNADNQMRELLPPEADGWDDEQIADYLVSNEIHLSTVRRNLGLLKTPLACAWVDNFLDGAPGKIIVACIHTSVIDKTMELLKSHNPVKVDGRDTFNQRANAVEEFTRNPKCRVFVGQIQAAGVALTLTAASDIAFFEASWTPEDNNQMASRAHRFGQTNPVLARFLTVPGTLDARITKTAARKAAELSEIF
jgi:SWI/SNF-related matrix-associated actin-dependent regulator of chromatin subfamily A-like protein 1